MDTKLILVALMAFIIGLGGGYLIAGSNTPAVGERMVSDGAVTHSSSGMGGAMGDMLEGLRDKTGDAFDRAFITEMTLHHQGAVEMAEAALVNAKHEEIRQMANAIISAQTAEIQQMQAWQESWYGAE